jgi:hypothetical protein
MINPELRRYAWLELGLHRLVMVPLVLGTLAAMLLFASDSPAEALANGALSVFAVLTLGWGTMRAYGSVTEEVRERTWDFQRMAAIDPWSLAWGKLIGAPLLAWYMGAWCLLVFGLAGAAARLPHLVATLVGAVALAVLLHSLGVAASALSARTALSGRARRSGSILLLLLLLYLIPTLLVLGWSEGSGAVRIQWWGLQGLHPRTFMAMSAVLFAGWAAFGAWRAMARELREPGWWWPWPAFAVCAALWWAGFSTATVARATLPEVLALASTILVAGTYLGLTLDPLTPVSWARLDRVGWRRRAPGWMLNGVLALALGAAALLWAFAIKWFAGSGGAIVLTRVDPLPLIAPALALMVLRDAAIVTCFTMTVKARRPLALATFYIAMADLLLPAFLSAVGLAGAAHAVFPLLGYVVSPVIPLAGLAAHLGLAVVALWWRLRLRRGVP